MSALSISAPTITMNSSRRLRLLLTYCLTSFLPAVPALMVRQWTPSYRNRPPVSVLAQSQSQDPWQHPDIQSLDTAAAPATHWTIQVPQHYKKDSDGYPSRLHTIYIEPLLSPEEVEQCLALAVTYGRDKWQTPDDERHTNFPTCDFPVEEASDLATFLDDMDFQQRIFQRLSQAYGLDMDDMMGFIDLFCVNYVANTNDNNSDASLSGDPTTMDRLGAHRDGSIVSFTVLLSPPSQFDGGGTFFDALAELPPDTSPVLHPNGVIRPPDAGYAVLHSGKLLHGADVVTHGQRTVLVGFVDVAEWAIHPGAERQACTSFGRMDVANRRATLQQQRQQETALMMEKHGMKSSCWSASRSTRFLPRFSCMNKVIPAFPTAIWRADMEFQRRTKLAAEDVLLRTILIDEKPEYLKRLLASGEITVL
jgi:hypothetical protein